MLFVSATKQAPYGLFAVVLDNGRKENCTYLGLLSILERTQSGDADPLSRRPFL